MTVNVRQTEVSPRMPIRQPLMVQSHQVKHGGLQIMNMNGGINDVETELIGLPDTDSRLDSTTRKPHGKRLRMVISPQRTSQ